MTSIRPASRRPSRRLLTVVALLLALTAPRGAAEAQGSALALAPTGYSRLASINPLLLVFFGTISADYEQRVTPSVTLGASGASFDLSDANYLTLEGKARYYLSGRAFDGFAVSAAIGLTSMKADSSGARAQALSIGFGAERTWLAGPEERLALTAGAGAARLFGAPDRDEFRTILPSLRLSLGWGF